MWTRGWDLFAPDQHVVFHLWERSYRTTFWEVEGATALKRASQERVRQLLTGKRLHATDPTHDTPTATNICVEGATPRATDPIWSLGEVRALGMYEAFSGVNFATLSVGAQAECVVVCQENRASGIVSRVCRRWLTRLQAPPRARLCARPRPLPRRARAAATPALPRPERPEAEPLS